MQAPKRQRGRPRVANPKNPNDYPTLRVRVTPDLEAWVKRNGGAELVRRLLEIARQESSPPDQKDGLPGGNVGPN